MATPLITPAMLTARPAGLSWQVVPTLTAPGDLQQAQLLQVCWTASSAVDRYCRQPLRATVVTESKLAPGEGRIRIYRETGLAMLVTHQWPVTQVLAVQTSPARSLPPVWTLVPDGFTYIGKQPEAVPGMPSTGPSGGNTIEVAPGYVSWDRGRGHARVSWSYISGWPHCGLTANATPVNSGAQTIQVDDVTDWDGPFSTGFAYDGTSTELVTVTAAVADAPVQLPGAAGTVQAGPGTLTLSAPLQNAHAAGTVVSAVPSDVLRAVALHCAVQALELIDAIATQSQSGQMAGSTGALETSLELVLDDYRSWT
jgi:hypothetical protein